MCFRHSFFGILILTVSGAHIWREILEDFFEEPHISNDFDQSISLALHAIAGISYEKNDFRLDACLEPLEYEKASSDYFNDRINGFVGYKPANEETPGMILVFFTGTRNPVQLYHEWLRSDSTPFETVPEARIMKYFKEGTDKLYGIITKRFRYYYGLCPDCLIYFTGHSLGAALALTTMARYLYSGILTGTSNVNFYGFGQPRVGNREFASWVDSFGLPVFRVVHDNDAVPHIPCCHNTFLGSCTSVKGEYSPWHVSTEVFYDSDFRHYRICNHSPKGEDGRCSNRYLAPQMDINSHINYYGIRTSHVCEEVLGAHTVLKSARIDDSPNYNLTQAHKFTWPKFC